MKKSLSQYITNMPAELFAALTDAEFAILSTVLEWSQPTRYRLGGITLSQVSIAQKHGVTAKTVNRAFTKFRQLGLIETVRRWNNSCVTKITNWWGSPKVQEVLPHFFLKFPIYSIITKITLLVSMLGSGGYNKNKSTYFLKQPERLFGSGINISTRQRRRGIVESMKPKIDKVNLIHAALIKKGETGYIDRYKLLAFNDACLDDCSAKMKMSPKPRSPFAYFLKMALDYCKYNNYEPDWQTADTLRESQGVPEFEGKFGFRQNSGRTDGKSYSKGETKAPWSNIDIIQETKERQKREQSESNLRMDKVRRESPYKDTQYDPSNPYMQMVLKAQLAELQKVDWDSEDGKRIRQFFSDIGVPL